MPPGEGSTPGNIVHGDVRPRRPRPLIFQRCSGEKLNPENLEWERQVGAYQQARMEEQKQMMTASIVGTLSFTVSYPHLGILSDDHVEYGEITLNDVSDSGGTSMPPLLIDSTQQGKGRLLKDSAKPLDDSDFLDGTFFKINSDKQKATTRNKKSSKKQKKKKGKGKSKGRKQSHASEMQSDKRPTEPSSTCATETCGETLASSSSCVAVGVPLLEYSSSCSSSRVTEKLIITPAVNSAASGNEKELSASSSNGDFKSFKSTTSYATAASSSMNNYASSLSDTRSERSLSASDSTDSRGFKKMSGEGNKPHVHQSLSSAIGPGCSQQALLCTDDASNDRDFQKVVSRKSAKKMKKMQQLKNPAPSSTKAASSGNIITSALVPRAPFREVITMGHYINDETFYGRKPNKKKGKYQKARSLSNLSKTGYTDGDNSSGSDTMLVIVHQAKPRSSPHVTLEVIEETNSPSCCCPPKEGELKAMASVCDGIKEADSKAPLCDKPSSPGHQDNSSCIDQKKAMALAGGDTKDTDSRAPTSDTTSSLCHPVISSCADSEEGKKEENRIVFSTHPSSQLDKIITAANDAYEIQAASDVYMTSGIHADIENFLHAATPVIEQISWAKRNISLQGDQRLWSVWSWYEEPECCGIEVQMQGKINSIWPEFSTYFRPLLSAVQLFGKSGKSQNHGVLIFEYFEKENPYSRPPFFTKIKQLHNGVNLSAGQVFGDPKQLESVKLSDLHPASWFSVAWYPICQIPAPAGSCQASFLTYHSLGKLAPQTCSTDKADGHDHIICPIVGLLGYKDQGEKWFQLRRQQRFKSTPNVLLETDHAELLNKRLRTLRQGASIMSKAVVPRASGEAMNCHSDYEFFRFGNR